MITIQQCVHLLQSNQIPQAVAGLKVLLQANTKDVEAHQLLGVCHIMLADYKLAEKHLLKALKLKPNHLDAQYNLARLYSHLNQHSKAKAALLKVLKVRPNWLEARFSLGLAAVGLLDKDLARASFNEVLAVQPNNAEAWFNLGNIDYNDNLFAEAKACYEKALAIDSGSENTLLALAGVLYYLNQIEAGISLLEEYMDDAPSSDYILQLSKFYGLQGQKVKANELAREAIDKDPLNGEAHRIYIESKKIDDVSQLSDLRQAIQSPGVDSSNLKSMYYAMSLGLEACGEFAEAMDHLNKANELARKVIKYNTRDSIGKFEKLKKIYSKANIEKALGAENMGNQHIFILGMPRSGTSLVEQILASHSEVYGAGELTLLSEMWREQGCSSETKFHANFISKGSEYWAQIGELYSAEVLPLASGEAKITDKLPHNFLMIGLIAMSLPQAKIIHCKRHPVANCLSIYKANFAGGHDYACNLKELAEYHNLYEDLMAHWRLVLPNCFYELKYEDLTSNQEQETRDLLSYCDLDWQDTCMNFHKSGREVKTASAYQVRQSMHTRSVDLWRKYGDGLKPLLDHLYIPEEYRD